MSFAGLVDITEPVHISTSENSEVYFKDLEKNKGDNVCTL